MSLGLRIRYLYPSMMKAATVAEKRPVCQMSLGELARGRRYKRTHEDEDTIHVALPAFHKCLIVLLTLPKNDGP